MYNLFVGSLPFSMTEEELNKMFSEYGTVASAKIILDRETQRSRGFAFVEFEDEAEGKAAQAALDGKEVDGQKIHVNQAREKR